MEVGPGGSLSLLLFGREENKVPGRQSWIKYWYKAALVT